MADPVAANARDLDAELEWLAHVLKLRLSSYFADPSASPTLPNDSVRAPAIERSDSPYARLVTGLELPPEERLILVLALAPHLRPQLLDVLWARNEATQRGFSEFGGVESGSRPAFLPTGETALFLLSGDDLGARLSALRSLKRDGALARHGLVELEDGAPNEPAPSGALVASRRLLSLVTQGNEDDLAFDHQFPARRVETSLDWSDLVLPGATLEQLEEVRSWLEHGRTLLHDWGMQHRLSAGYTCLFHGPPGTGKTLSACLLGKLCDSPVYKIDLSMVVSKYIGETEKNLGRVFDQAEHRRWILFFDEADALFGKRTRVDDAHDRYANQEVSFLLQRIEDFDGVVILASNLKSNIDEAFLRRFQSVVQFPMPRVADRLRIWREAFSRKAELDAGLDLELVAERHELSGGTIVNVVRYASLAAIRRGSTTILSTDVEQGIRRELLKEGRAF